MHEHLIQLGPLIPDKLLHTSRPLPTGLKLREINNSVGLICNLTEVTVKVNFEMGRILQKTPSSCSISGKFDSLKTISKEHNIVSIFKEAKKDHQS